MKRFKKFTELINVKIDKPLFKEINKACRKEKISRSELIRSGICAKLSVIFKEVD